MTYSTHFDPQNAPLLVFTITLVSVGRF